MNDIATLAPPAAPALMAMPAPTFAQACTPPTEIGPPKSILLYGKTGTRKTSSIGEAVKNGFYKKVLWIDLDNGSEVLAEDPEVRAAMHDGRITVYPINPFASDAKDLIEAAIFEVAGVWRTPSGTIDVHPSIPDFGYDLVVIDTVNLMHEVALKYFQLTTFSEKTGKPDGLGAYAKIGVWDDEMLRLIHNSTRFAGAFLMHSKEVQEETGQTRVVPKLSGAFQNSISAIPSITAYLSFEKNPGGEGTVLTAVVGESDTYEAKNRYRLEPKIWNFNLSELLARIPNNRTAPVAAHNPALAA